MSTESVEQSHGCWAGRGGQRVQEPAGTESCHGHGHGHERGTQHTQHPSVRPPLQPCGGHGVSGRVQGPGWCRSTCGQGELQGLYQGLVGREHGGVSAVPVQGHQWHRPEFLLGQVGGGAPAQDHGAQVIVLRTGTGWARGSRPASPVPALPSWVAPPACTHLSLEDAGGPVPQLGLP